MLSEEIRGAVTTLDGGCSLSELYCFPKPPQPRHLLNASHLSLIAYVARQRVSAAENKRKEYKYDFEEQLQHLLRHMLRNLRKELC